MQIYFSGAILGRQENLVRHHALSRLAPPPRALTWLLLVAILLVAFFLRTFELDRFPRGPYYDEAAATILAGEVATGRSWPIFILPYTGHEVLFYYLAAVVMRLSGISVLTLRLTSALIGVTTVLLAYLLARELFQDEPGIESHWLGLFAAALMATSFWHISVSRYGFRAITQPLVQSLLLLALWRGLRRDSWKWIVAAGVFCGLVAYTYLASRVTPVALAILLPMVLIAERRRWRSRLAQLSLFTLVALVVFAPLGLFFVAHPEAFSVRMNQISIFSEGGGNSWQAAAIRNTLRAIQVFTLRGDPTVRFNLPTLPMFQGPLAVAFYIGLAVVAVGWARQSGFLGRVRYVLLVVWPLAMLLPTILSDPIEIPHSLRAIGVMPLAFYVPALGLAVVTGLIQNTCLARNPRAMTAFTVAVLAITLGGSAANTFQNYFVRWATLPRLYYDNNQDIADMARYLDSLQDDTQTLYVGSPDYRHPTVAALAHNFDRMKWLGGGEVFVFPSDPALYAWPHASLPDDLWLARFFPPELRRAQELGPDGALAYMIYGRDHPPVIVPSHPLSATFGGVIQAIGYDVLRDRPSGGRTDVAVYWRILRKPDRGDYSEFFTLTDAWGMAWGQAGSFAYPSEQWTPGEIIAERVRIQTDDGTPPGNTFAVKLGWWSSLSGQRLPATDGEGRFAGTTITLSPITVTRRIRPLDVNAINMAHRLDRDWGGLVLLGYDQWPAFVRQGESAFVTLYWQARSAPLPDRTATLELLGSDGHAIVLSRGGPVQGTYPTSKWDKDEFVADRLALRIPPDTPPATYTLQVQVDDLPPQPLDRLDVQAIARNWTLPATTHPMSVTLGEQIALVGYDIQYPTPALRAGASVPNTQSQTVDLTLHWQALKEMSENYTVFVHLVDASGAVRAQKDNWPVNDTYPTTLWQPGEFASDAYTLSLPSDLPPGEYTLDVGLYLADTGARLATAAGENHIALETMSITH